MLRDLIFHGVVSFGCGLWGLVRLHHWYRATKRPIPSAPAFVQQVYRQLLLRDLLIGAGALVAGIGILAWSGFLGLVPAALPLRSLLELGGTAFLTLGAIGLLAGLVTTQRIRRMRRTISQEHS